MTHGQRLRRVRRKMGRTQAVLGEILGYSQPDISEMERGLEPVPVRVQNWLEEQARLLIPALPAPQEPAETLEFKEGRAANRKNVNVAACPFQGHGERVARRDWINGWFIEQQERRAAA